MVAKSCTIWWLLTMKQNEKLDYNWDKPSTIHGISSIHSMKAMGHRWWDGNLQSPWPMSCSASDAESPTMAYPMKIYVEIEVSMGKSCTKGEFSIATFDYRSVNRPAHRQAARKCGVRSLRSLRWKCWWGDGWAVSDADNFYFLKMFSGLVSGLGGPMGTHGDPHLGRKVKQQHPKLAILRWIIMQQIGLGHPSLRRAHFMPMMNCWWKGRLKGKSILKGIILHSWRGLPQKDRKIQKQLEEDQAKPSVQCWIAYPEQQSQENSVSSGIKGYCGL
jgi:hypothetical protein